MGWRPWEVRQCGLAEFGAVVDGFLKSKGVDPDDDPDGDRMTLADLERMKAKVANG